MQPDEILKLAHTICEGSRTTGAERTLAREVIRLREIIDKNTPRAAIFHDSTGPFADWKV